MHQKQSSTDIDQLNEKYSIRSGIASTMVNNVSNSYYALFAIGVLGASNYQVGLISSLPQFIGMFAMVIGSFIMNRLERKKKFTAHSIFYTRLFIFAMVFIIYIPEQFQSWAFVLLVGFMNLPGAFANLSWQSFIGDLIPDNRRSSFFSDRNRVLTFVAMIATLLMGIMMQQFDKSNSLPYQMLFLLAFLFGMAEVFYVNKHIEIKREKIVIRKTVNFGLDVFKHKPFLYFLICGLFFNFAWQMSWPLFSIYQIKYAGATGLWISLFAVANQIGQIVSFKWWGRMADKHGNAMMLILISLGMATAPILTILSGNLFYLFFINLFTGMFVSGTLLILFNQLLEVTEKENRSNCISNYNILLAVVGFIAPQFGVYLLQSTNMDMAMSISTVLRGASALFFFFLYMYLKKKRFYMKQIQVSR